MIDWHSHILPCIDDGSHSITESIRLLNSLKAQGVDTVIATPHFYANSDSVPLFLEKRKSAYDNIKDFLTDDLPQIILGAEVHYYPGISRMADLKQLRVDNTRLLLLELPVSRWTEYTIRELLELSSDTDIKIVLAHVERYYGLQPYEIFEQLSRNGILMQVNASSFCDFSLKRKVLKLLCSGMVQFIGSDCHNLTTRPPNMDKAFNVVFKKLGTHFLNEMKEYGYSVLYKNK